MPELFWFLLGCVTTLLTTLAALAYLRARRRANPRRPGPLPKRPRPRRIELSETRSLRELSESLGAELANLATGVEGQSQLLCESLGEPHRTAEHAEELWETIRRLRFFSEKLQSSSTVPDLELRPTNVGKLLAALVLEIEHYSNVTLQVSLSTAPSLPRARTNVEALRTAMLFLIESVFDLEPNASTLLLQAQAEEIEDDKLVVRIDIEAAPEDGEEIRVKSPPEILFSYLAARNLLHAQGAGITLDHSPGLSAVASITLEATPQDAASGEYDDADSEGDSDTGLERPHQFGGVLIMEGNPTIRHILARELHKTQRNVIVCADGVAAASLFAATPERFELLILEQESRRLLGEQVALRALAAKPELKILLISPAPGAPIDTELAARTHLKVLRKPFGLMELRDSLSSTLGPRPAGETDPPVPAEAL